MSLPLQIYIDTSLLPSLLDGTLKVVLAANAEAIVPVWPSDSVRVLRFQRVREHAGILYENTLPQSAITELHFPPTHVAVLWSFEEKESEELKLLQQWWRQHGAKESIPPLQLGTFESLQAFLITRLSQEVSMLVRRNTDLHQAMTTLREEHQATRKVLVSLQETMQSLRLTHRHMIASYAPTEAALEMNGNPDDKKSAIIHQLLPCPAKGLAGVDIFIQRGPEGQGILLASLIACDNNQELAGWYVPFSEMIPGWLHLALPKALTQSHAHVELVLQHIRLQGEAPLLGLCAPGVLDEYYLRRGDIPQEEQTLAMRVWGGLPGSEDPQPSYYRQAGMPPRFEYALSSAELSPLRKTRDIHAGFEYVQQLPNGKLLLHPVKNETVSIMLPGIIPASTLRIAASVAIEHERCASPVEFACAVAPSFTIVEDLINPPAHMLFSGWLEIEKPMHRHLLELSIPEPMAQTGDLYLFTRVAPERSVDYAHAIFHEITVTVDLAQIMAHSRREDMLMLKTVVE